MRQRTAHLEWQFAEDPDEWHSLTGLTTPVTRPSLPRRVVWGGLLALLVMLAAAGGWLWRTSHIGLATLESEIDAAVNAEVWVERQGVADVQLVDLAGDVAVVEVELPAAAGLPISRQTHVYQHTGGGWTRTLPSAAQWGSPRRLETRYFVFAYHELDEEAVKVAAAHLDRLYPTLYAAFFAGAPPPNKLVVQVDPAHMPSDFTMWMKRQDPMIIASPAAYLTPGSVTPEELLTQPVVLMLLDDLEFQISAYYARLPHRRSYEGESILLWPLVSGVSLWQLWASDLPLAQWREPVVQWVFSYTNQSWGEPRVEPVFKPALCAMHGLWMASPLYIQLPFSCDDRFEKSDLYRIWFRDVLPSAGSLPLTQRYILADDSLHPTRQVALATAVEYAAATYGKERIPLLLASLDEHGTWEALVVDVFGVSAEEFEAGWVAYLAEHYGIGEVQIVGSANGEYPSYRLTK